MRILVFDTETSGLDPQWNVILQLSYQIVDSNSWAAIKTVWYEFKDGSVKCARSVYAAT